MINIVKIISMNCIINYKFFIIFIFLYNNILNAQFYFSFSSNFAFPNKPSHFNNEWDTSISPSFGIGIILSDNYSLEIIFNRSNFLYNEESLSLLGYSVEGGNIIQTSIILYAKAKIYSILNSLNTNLLIGLGTGVIEQKDSKIYNGSEITIKGRKKENIVYSIGTGTDFEIIKNINVFSKIFYNFIFSSNNFSKSIQIANLQIGTQIKF